MTETNATARLGAFVHRCAAGPMAPEILEKAAICLLDTLGLAHLARNEATAVATRSLALRVPDGPGTARIWADHSRVPLSEAVTANAVAVHAHGGVPRLEDVEGDSGAKESRVFDDNGVTGFEHHLGDKVKTLLRTVKYKDVVGSARGAVVPHALSDLGTQLRNAI